MKYIIIALTLISCNMDRSSAPISTEPLDTIKTLPAQVVAAPFIFENAFIKGTTQNVNKINVSFYGVTIGKLKITSGRIVTCDPGHIDEYGIPFTQDFPIGEFPVQLSIANAENEETIAFARVMFSDEPVAKWEFALQKGQEQLPIGQKKRHGYSVDLGLGMFADEDASKAIDKTNLTEFDAEAYKGMDKHTRFNWRYTMHNFGNHNIAIFSSGFGDGYYSTYIGFDANGEPCQLLTDFNLIDWKEK